MKCILLCAGYATRLFPLTENFPKALLEVGGQTILDYILKGVNEVKEVDQIYVITNDRYYNHFLSWKEEKNNIIPIEVINDYTKSNDDRLGAIGDIWYTISQKNIDDDLLIIAGDNLFNYSLADAVDYFKDIKNAVVCSKPSDDKEFLKSVAIAKLDDNNKIIELIEKPENPESNIVVYATYLYPKNVIPLIKQYLDEGNKPDAPGYFLQYLYKIQDVYAYNFNGNCFDVGTHESLKLANDLYNKNN